MKSLTVLNEQIQACRHCPRIRSYQDKNAQTYPQYWNRPVTASGTHKGLTIVGLAHKGLTIVGLAPGLHGANKTGIPFTGDASGDLLFRCLKKLGLQNKVCITNAVKCAPPQNAPRASERKNCRKFLSQELDHYLDSQGVHVLFCLGRVAHEETLRSLNLKLKDFEFGHANVHKLSQDPSQDPSQELWLVDSYHCSRYNIQTNRITEPMFLSALQSAATLAQL